MQIARNETPGKRRLVYIKLKAYRDSLGWTFRELEDSLKLHIENLRLRSWRRKCGSPSCKNCYPETDNGSRVPPTGRVSSIFQKIRTWPRFGSKRVRDQSNQDAQQSQREQSLSQGTKERLKAASFPQKTGEAFRGLLPKFKKFESIREEGHGGPTSTEDGLRGDHDNLYPNVVGLEIDAPADATPSVEDLHKFSFSSMVSNGGSFGMGENSLEKPYCMAGELSGRTSELYITPPGASEFSQGAWSASQGEQSGRQSYANEGSPNEQVGTPSSSEGCTLAKSRFKGVRRKAGKWTSEIRPRNSKKTLWLGTYATEEEAASAHDAGIFYCKDLQNITLHDYNFQDSQEHLPPLDRSQDDLTQSNFIKTQARLLARRMAGIMNIAASGAAPTRIPPTPVHPPAFQSETQTADSAAIRAGSPTPRPRLLQHFSLKRSKSGDHCHGKNVRRKH